MIFNKNKLFFVFLLFFLYIFNVSLVFAEPDTKTIDKSIAGTDEGITWLFNPLNNSFGKAGHMEPSVIFSNLIKFLLSLVGTLSFIAFIIGGTMWLVSGGESDKVKKGKDIFIYASIGLAVVFSSYVVLRFVIQTVTGQ